MSFLSTYYDVSADKLIGLISVLVVGFGFSLIGAAVGGRNRYPSVDLLVGWSIAALVFTLTGVLSLIPFTYVAIGLGLFALASGAYVWRRDGRLLPDGTLKILALVSLLFLLVTAMEPSQWDEYSHWLPSARYLFEIDTFAREGLEKPIADLPGYPPAQSLVPYLVSKLAGRFVENASPLFHILILISLGLAAMDLIRRGAQLDTTKKASWGFCALGFMAVTIFSTAFVQKVIFTAYADLPVAAATAFFGLLGWLILEALERGDQSKARTLAIQAGFILLLLLSVKPATVVLVIGISFGLFIAIVRDPDIRAVQILKLIPWVYVPGIVVFWVWSGFADQQYPLGTQRVMPFEKWQWHQMPQTLSVMGTIALKKGAYFGMMITLSVLSLVAIFRYRTHFDRFALMVGSTFVAYNLFLAFVYLAIFGGFPGAHALSYWRYNMHLAHLGVFCSAFGLAVLWHRYQPRYLINALSHLSKIGVVLLMILPLVFAHKIRFDIRAPKQFVKQVGVEMRDLMPPTARLLVLDPLSAGFYAKLMRYQLYGEAIFTKAVNVIEDSSAEGIRKVIEETRADHIWVHTQNAGVVEGLGVDLAERNAHFLRKSGDGWELVKSWPYPGYNKPQDIPD